MPGFKTPILNNNIRLDQGTLARACSTLTVVTGMEQSAVVDKSFLLNRPNHNLRKKSQYVAKKVILQDTQKLPCDGRGNEVARIAAYMADEMSKNAKSYAALKMSKLNKDSDFSKAYNACIKEWSGRSWYQQLLIDPNYCISIGLAKKSNKVEAIILWTLKVAQNSVWDHKPYIRKTFHPAVPNGEQVWHHYDRYLYYYDIWSNIHYGYVGRACGFSESELLDGAGIEQIGSDLLRFKLPSGKVNVEGLRAFDDSSDRESISIGIALHKKHPDYVTSQAILSRVKNASKLTKKPC